MFKMLRQECLHHHNLLKMNHEFSELVLNPVWSCLPLCVRIRVSSSSMYLGYMGQVRVNNETISIWAEQNTASIATTNEKILKSVIKKKKSFLCCICGVLWKVKWGTRKMRETFISLVAFESHDLLLWPISIIWIITCKECSISKASGLVLLCRWLFDETQY